MVAMIKFLLLFLFFLSIFLCFGTYVLYPLLLILIGTFKKIKIQKKEITPSVSIIISAYNEEGDIAHKIKNTRNLDYPKGKVEILIGCDGSTDNTAKIVNDYLEPGIKFFNFRENRGKTSVQNDLVEAAENEILIFTDAASFLPKDALKKIVRNFYDNRVGCVAGKMRFIDTNKNITTQSQGLYWKYEVTLRLLESMLGSLIGVDGPLYAMKKKYYVPLPPNIISDLMTPLLVLGMGKKVVLEPEAFVDELPKDKATEEFETRRRVALRGMTGIFTYPDLLNPKKNLYLALQILFHKVIRWWVGPLVILNILTCVLLATTFSWLQPVIVLYLLFLLSAFTGKIKKNTKVKIFTIPYYFCLVNFAATMAIIDFFRKRQATTWKTVR
ncbi:MAG: glycosyltransferase family 2 protein [Thermodesulfobacteriota bacterium]|nr:glycosyltransferase family 2 protein [Thermodesulfobacteriota bacterium]